MKEENRIFAENLKRLIEKRHKTQAEVADALHINRPTFNTWVKGDAMPRAGKLQLIADYFSVGKSQLIEMVDEDEEARLQLSRMMSIIKILNYDGLEKLQERAEELAELPKYRKDGD